MRTLGVRSMEEQIREQKQFYELAERFRGASDLEEARR